MINVCIIEDEKCAEERLKENLLLFGKEKAIEFAITCFSCAEDFLKRFVPLAYDVLFFDIDLSGMDGMTAAKKVRENDFRTLIIFITNVRRLAIEGYAVNALDYLVKPLDKLSLFATMERALKHIDRRRSIDISVNTSEGIKYLSSSEIAYIEVFDHILYYHATSGILKEFASLNKPEKLLEKHNFVRCNKCYLVNLRYVSSISGDKVVVAGDTLKITRSKKPEFIKALNAYICK